MAQKTVCDLCGSDDEIFKAIHAIEDELAGDSLFEPTVEPEGVFVASTQDLCYECRDKVLLKLANAIQRDLIRKQILADRLGGD